MLSHLRVRNIALIDDVSISFSDGFNVLTGETGAGKSILLNALSVALGSRASKDLLGDPEKPANVDLVFDVARTPAEKALIDLGILTAADQGELIITREIAPSGKAVSHVNNRITTATQIKDIADVLIDLHGQHEHQSLLDANRHIDLLDGFDPRTEALKDQLYQGLVAYKAKDSEYRALQKQGENRDSELSLWQFELDEIDQADIQEGEEEQLLIECKRASNLSHLDEELRRAYMLVRGSEAGSAAETTGQAALILSRLASDPEIAPLVSQVTEITGALDALSHDLSHVIENLQADPQTLMEKQERLAEIRRLKRKYGNTVDAIEAHREQCRMQIDRMIHLTETLEHMQKELHEMYLSLERTAADLTEIRKKIGAEISAQITDILKDLQFQDPKFYVSVTPRETISAKGKDTVAFLIRTNVGDELYPLEKIASGGEISRIMLAIKTVMADRDQIPTLIFDEIDTGISGRTAQRVAEKLATISRYHQVIAITHLPQIAAMSEHHMLIEKVARDGRAHTEVHDLDKRGIIEEIARMMAGATVTETALTNALEMKRAAVNWKNINLSEVAQ